MSSRLKKTDAKTRAIARLMNCLPSTVENNRKKNVPIVKLLDFFSPQFLNKFCDGYDSSASDYYDSIVNERNSQTLLKKNPDEKQRKKMQDAFYSDLKYNALHMIRYAFDVVEKDPQINDQFNRDQICMLVYTKIAEQKASLPMLDEQEYYHALTNGFGSLKEIIGDSFRIWYIEMIDSMIGIDKKLVKWMK